jgi:hypothetical protein
MGDGGRASLPEISPGREPGVGRYNRQSPGGAAEMATVFLKPLTPRFDLI